MPRVIPCEECGKMVTEDHQYVDVGVRINPPGPIRVHADCFQAYKDKKNKGKKSH